MMGRRESAGIVVERQGAVTWIAASTVCTGGTAAVVGVDFFCAVELDDEPEKEEESKEPVTFERPRNEKLRLIRRERTWKPPKGLRTCCRL